MPDQPHTPMNLSQARAIDPILSTIAHGYSNSELIFTELFPRVPIPVRGMRVIRFGKDSFRTVNARRAPGGSKKRIQYGYATDPVRLSMEDLEAIVPFEHMGDASAVPGVDLATIGVNNTMGTVMLNLEVQAADLATTAANYGTNNRMTLSGSDLWSDPASNPFADIKDGREAVRRAIGRYPNKLTLSAQAFDALCDHPAVVDRVKYTQANAVTEDMLARLFKVERVVVGKAIYLPEQAADTDPAIDVWGNHAILAYVPMGAAQQYGMPSYGYTYELQGHPQVMTPYVENSADSWIYPVKYEREPELTGVDGGFLFENAVAG